MKIAIDFDGTLIKRTGIPTKSFFPYDEPNEGAEDALWLFTRNKIEYYIHTNRPDKDFTEMRVWLEKWGFPNADTVLITREKQQGTTIYLDDRGYRFVSWNDFRKLVE